MGRTDATLLQRVGELHEELVDLLFGDDALREVSATGLGRQLAIPFYSQVRSLMRAVAILVREGHPEEAHSLLRQLLFASLVLQELVDRPADRDGIALAWRQRTLTEMENLTHEAVAAGLEKDPEALHAFVEEQREKLARRAAKDSLTPVQLAGEKQLAIDHGRRADYWTHKYTSVSIHRPDFAQLNRVRYGPEPATAMAFLTNADPAFLAGTLATAMTYTLHAHIAASVLFESDTDRAEDLLARLDAEVERWSEPTES